MATKKPPAVNPDAIRFDPKGNARDHSRVSREDRRANEKVPIEERERRAARARAQVATGHTAGREEEMVEARELQTIEAEVEREIDPRSHPVASHELARAPLGLNETHDEFDEPEDVSGDLSEDDDPNDSGEQRESAIELVTPGELVSDDDPFDENDELDEAEAREIEQEVAAQYEAAKQPHERVKHELGNDVPHDVGLADQALSALRRGPLIFGEPSFGGAVDPESGAILTPWGPDFTPGTDGPFRAFIMGDKIKILNPVTGEPVTMALVSMDWDADDCNVHVRYAPVQDEK